MGTVVRQLYNRLRDCIDRHVDQDQLRVLMVAEQSEREQLTMFA
jgi:hypothetical protein